jgi:hypothetical protein
MIISLLLAALKQYIVEGLSARLVGTKSCHAKVLARKSYQKYGKKNYHRFSMLTVICWQNLVANQMPTKSLACLSFSNQNLTKLYIHIQIKTIQ